MPPNLEPAGHIEDLRATRRQATRDVNEDSKVRGRGQGRGQIPQGRGRGQGQKILRVPRPNSVRPRSRPEMPY